MGRGRGNSTNSAEQANAALRTRKEPQADVSAILYGGLSKDSTTRSLKKRTFIQAKEEWKKQEKEYIDNVISELEDSMQRCASSDVNWQQYLKTYAQSPTYSALNNLWARAQLYRRGAPTDGLILSESAWRALGRRPKEEFARPDRRRDRKHGFDYDREWDDKYAVELMQPLGKRGFTKLLEDENGDPVLDDNGEQKKTFIHLPPKGFKSFVAYHEDATESLQGGTPSPLPGAPWANATGSDADAEKLLANIQEVIECKGLKVTSGHYKRDQRAAAQYSHADKTISINKDAPRAEQASAATKALFVALSAEKPADSDQARQRQKAAIESAKYVITSLYNLDSDEQTFPHLSEIAEEKNGLRKLSSEVHSYVGAVMSYLDPVIKAQVRQKQEYKENKK